MKVYDRALLAEAPPSFKSAPARYKEYKELAYSLQTAPEDCTGCSLCVEVCPVKNKAQPGLKAINGEEEFAASGKPLPKKDLGLLAMSYGSVYVARVAFGANDGQTIKAFLEAEAYEGPSLILAYSHCIAHGYDLKYGLEQQQAAVASGYWPLYRYNPEQELSGKNPFQLDSKPPHLPLENYVYREGRYQVLAQSHPERAARLLELAQADVKTRWQKVAQLAELNGHKER